MVATLMKHEIKRTSKPLGVIVGISIIIQLLASLGIWLTGQSSGISGFFILLDLLGLAVIGVAPLAYLVVDYWRTNYTATGYLTQSIPLPGATKYWTKFVWSTIALFVSAALTLASIVWLLAIWGTIRGNGGFGAPARDIFHAAAQIPDLLPTGITLAIICYLIIQVPLALIPFYFSISVGFEAWALRLGKLGGPIVTWVGYYMICQIIGVLSMFVFRLGISFEPGSIGKVVTYSFADLTQNPTPVVPLIAILVTPLLGIILACRTAYSWEKKVTLN